MIRNGGRGRGGIKGSGGVKGARSKLVIFIHVQFIRSARGVDGLLFSGA